MRGLIGWIFAFFQRINLGLLQMIFFIKLFLSYKFKQQAMELYKNLNKILEDKNHHFPSYWSNLLIQIPQDEWIQLSAVGKIVNISYNYFLVFDDSLYQYYVLDQTKSKINKSLEKISNKKSKKNYLFLNKQINSFLIDEITFILKRYIFSNISLELDLGDLGIIKINRSNLIYTNGKICYTFQRKNNKFNLPIIVPDMVEGQKRSVSIIKMGRKFSLSITKENDKEKRQKSQLKRPRSSIKIPTLKNIKQKQDYRYLKLSTQPHKELIERARTPKRKLTLKTTQSQKKNSTSTPKNSSRGKSTQKQIIKKDSMPNSFFKIKSKNNGNKLVLKQRQKLKTVEDEEFINKVNVYNFVKKCTFNVKDKFMIEGEDTYFEMEDFLVEVTDIYISKARLCEKKQRKPPIKMQRPQRFQKQQIESILISNKNSFKLVPFYIKYQQLKMICKRLTKSYAHNFQQHKEIVISYLSFMKKCEKDIQKEVHKLIRRSFTEFIDYHKIIFNKIKEKKAVGMLIIHSSESFLLDVEQLTQTFLSIYELFQQYFCQIAYLRIQPHEKIEIIKISQQLQDQMIQKQEQFERYFQQFITKENKILIPPRCYISWQLNEKHIKDLTNFMNQIEEIPQLIKTQNCWICIKNVIDGLTRDIRLGLDTIYEYLIMEVQKNERQLLIQVKTVPLLTGSYLSDYVCQQYRLKLQNLYNKSSHNMQLLIHYFSPKIMDKIPDYLQNCLMLQIRKNEALDTFNRRLLDFKVENKVICKELQLKNKQLKQVYAKMSSKMKKIMLEIKKMPDINEQKDQIQKIDNQFKKYSKEAKLIAQKMIQFELIYWQDDPFLETTLMLLNKSLNFQLSKEYKILFMQFLEEANYEQIKAAFQEFTLFLQKFKQVPRLEKIFSYSFQLYSENINKITYILCKSYDQNQTQKLKGNGLNLQDFNNIRTFKALKKLQILDQRKQQNVKKIFREAKLKEYQKQSYENVCSLKIKIKKEGNISIIDNLIDIRMKIEKLEKIEKQKCIDNINQVQIVMQNLTKLERTMRALYPKPVNHVQLLFILAPLRENFDKIIQEGTVSNICLSELIESLETNFQRYSQILYLQRVNIFPKYCLFTFEQILCLEEWSTDKEIQRNLQIIFQQVDEFIIVQKQIKGWKIDKQIIELQKPLIINDYEQSKALWISNKLEQFLKSSFNSRTISTQFSLLMWHIYHTQQVQFCLQTSSLSVHKEFLIKIIEEHIKKGQLDFSKKNYFQLEILLTQFNIYLAHIEKIFYCIQNKNDYEWISSVRMYQKSRNLIVQQMEKSWKYGWQIKKVKNYQMDVSLTNGVHCGLIGGEKILGISSYIIGSPYCYFASCEQYKHQKDFKYLINVANKFSYCLHFIFEKQSLLILNSLYSKAIQLKNNNHIDQQQKNLSLFIQFQKQQSIPQCFNFGLRFHYRSVKIALNVTTVILVWIDKLKEEMTKKCIDQTVIKRLLIYLNGQDKIHFDLKVINSFFMGLEVQLKKQESYEDGLYTFCFQFLMNLKGVNNVELARIIQKLKSINFNSIEAQKKQIKISIHKLKSKQSDQNILLYGPPTFKTHFLKEELKLKKYSSLQTQKSLYLIEGFQKYSQISKNIKQNNSFVIEDRGISNLDPFEISQLSLFYISPLRNSQIKNIFNFKLDLIFPISNTKNNFWDFFQQLYQIYKVASGRCSMLTMMDFLMNSYSLHLKKYVKRREQDQMFAQLSVNKETEYAFVALMVEICHYGLNVQKRKTFIENFKRNPMMQAYKREDLVGVIMFDLTPYRLTNFIKKQASTIFKPINLSKEIIIFQKYLDYGFDITISHESYVTKKIIKKELSSINSQLKVMSLNPNHLNYIFDYSSKKCKCFLIEDVHLMQKLEQQNLKCLIENQSEYKRYILLNNRNKMFQWRNVYEFYIADPEIEQIFGKQMKEGISDQLIKTIKELHCNNFFKSQVELFQFLISVTIKLPSLIYKKFFYKQLIYRKIVNLQPSFTLQIVDKILNQNLKIEGKQLKTLIVKKKNTMQQVNQLDKTKAYETALKGRTYVQQILITHCYKNLMCLCLSQKLYIIKEDKCLIPLVICELQKRKYYHLQQANFIEYLCDVIFHQELLLETDFTVIFHQPSLNEPDFILFVNNYLSKNDLIILFPDFQKFIEKNIQKESFISNNSNIRQDIENMFVKMIQKRMRIIISVCKYGQFTQFSDEFSNGVLSINAGLNEQMRDQLGKKLLQKYLKKVEKDLDRQLLKQVIENILNKNQIQINRIELLLDKIINSMNTNPKTESRSEIFLILKSIQNAIEKYQKEIDSTQNHKQIYVEMNCKIIKQIKQRSIKSQVKTDNDFSLKYNQAKYDFYNRESQNFQIHVESQKQLLQQLLKNETTMEIIEKNIDIIFFKPSYEFVTCILQSKQKRNWLKLLINKHNKKQSFIIVSYLNYVIKIAQICSQSQIILKQEQIQQQVDNLRYFYLMDLSFNLKDKIQEYSQKIKQIKAKSQTLVCLEQSVNDELAKLAISHQKKSLRQLYLIIRQQSLTNGLILHQQLPSLSHPSTNELEERLETNWQNLNYQFQVQMLNQYNKLVFYDPHGRFEKIYTQQKINIIYLNCDKNEMMERLQDYHFNTSVYSIKIDSSCEYIEKKQQISFIQDFLMKKHIDIKGYTIEKLAIIITNNNTIPTLQLRSPIVNLSYSFESFYNDFMLNFTHQKYNFNKIKKSYIEFYLQFQQQLNLIKVLRNEELEFYILKMKELAYKLQEKRQDLKICLEKIKEEFVTIDILKHFYNGVIFLDTNNILPLNLFIRIFKKIDSEEMYLKFKQFILQSQKKSYQPSQIANKIKQYLYQHQQKYANNFKNELKQCIQKTSLLILIYQTYEKTVLNEIKSFERSNNIKIRVMFHINDQLMDHFMYQSCTGIDFTDDDNRKEVVIFMVGENQIKKIERIKYKCSVLLM